MSVVRHFLNLFSDDDRSHSRHPHECTSQQLPFDPIPSCRMTRLTIQTEIFSSDNTGTFFFLNYQVEF